MRAATKEWAGQFALRLDTCIKDWTSSCGHEGEMARAAEAEREVIEFVMKRVLVLEATVDALEELRDASMEAYFSTQPLAEDDSKEQSK